MSEYAVARLEEIGEISDGREPWRPVRHHFGITSFGINAWTGREAGDRIINEHDEEGEDEELYIVQSGRARFELEGERVDAPAGTFVFARPGVKRTAFAEEPGTTILAVGATPGQVYEPEGWELWAPFGRLYQEGRYAEAADQARAVAEAHPEYPGSFTTLRAARVSQAGRPTRSSICGLRSRGRAVLATTWRGTRISILFARNRSFRRSLPAEGCGRRQCRRRTWRSCGRSFKPSTGGTWQP